MIVVRNVFRLKFGQARPALMLWKEGLEIMRKAGSDAPIRLLTDLVGTSYTLVVEHSAASLTEFEQSVPPIMQNAEWKTWYQKFVPLCESGYREIFNVIE
jgi:hypothetical protein